LDPAQREELTESIKVLLADRSVMVLGSALAAWTEVCPDQFDLIHPHFRKLCHLLADIDEWGQIIVINMLTRYGRTQFEDPNKEVSYIEDI
jgi:AP-3 complex subunit beta